jgi:hypothetical protein
LVSVLSNDLKVILTHTDFLSLPNLISFSKISITLTSSMSHHATSLAIPAKSNESASLISSILSDFSISSVFFTNLSLVVRNDISLNTGGKLLTSLYGFKFHH